MRDGAGRQRKGDVMYNEECEISLSVKETVEDALMCSLLSGDTWGSTTCPSSITHWVSGLLKLA